MEEQKKRANEIGAELKNVTEQRLFATLNSEDSALTSDEAKLVLETINGQGSTMVDTFSKISIERDIKSLQDAELKFSTRLQQYEETDQEWELLLSEQEGAKATLTERKKQEIEARQAYDQAQKMVAEAKAHLVTTSNALRGVEQRVRKNAAEMDRVTSALAKKQQKVRAILRKKADMMSGPVAVEYYDEDDLASLRRKEIQLIGESRRIATMVERLQSRSEKLRARAEALAQYRSEAGTEKSGAPLNGSKRAP